MNKYIIVNLKNTSFSSCYKPRNICNSLFIYQRYNNELLLSELDEVFHGPNKQPRKLAYGKQQFRIGSTYYTKFAKFLHDYSTAYIGFVRI